MGRVFACTDLHGRKDLFDKINTILEEDDKVIFCGDAADRGPNGWEIIKAIIKDPRWIYILGNHEDMLVSAARDYFRTGSYGRNYSLLRSNGGKVTFHDMINDPKAKEVIDQLNNLSTYEIYKNAAGQLICLSHAGFTPWLDEDGALIVPEDEDLIWNRDHYLADWDEDMLMPNTIIIHGHTPIPYIMDDLRLPDNGDLIAAGPLWYSKNRKVCLDCASFATGAAFLLNLDTFEYHTFKSE
jgi:hypothetical protein